jgi:hypothetical protein
MRKNRLVRILLLPISAVLFMIGFVLMSVGTQKQKKPNKPISKDPSPTFEIGMLAPQENQQLVLEKAKQ